MVTFSDLMTLILVFFILLFAMSEIDLIKFKSFAESYQTRAIFDNQSNVVEMINPNPSSSGEQESNDDSTSNPIFYSREEIKQNKEDLKEMIKVIEVFLRENELGELITATRDERGIVLVLQERILFRSGEAEILQDARPFLNKIGQILATIPNLVKVEGHTDNVPISTYRYPSNWELSTARASAVIRNFIERNNLDPIRFTSVGYGEYRPEDTNETLEGRQNNRRVVIVISELDINQEEIY